MKYLKLGPYELAALALIMGAVALRLFLISQNWPFIDSDEGTFGIMASDIAYHGAHPIFFYGYYYNGALQSYLGAALFHFLGPSLFSLRLGILLLITLFFVSIYFLTRLLYSKALALVVLALLCLGSHYVLEYQIHSYGGYPDTLLFGTVIFLFAFLLAFFTPGVPLRKRLWRYLLYMGWGIVVGLACWSDMLIVPFAMMSGLLICLFCWRELLRILPIICIVCGLALGATPLIIYNLHAVPGDDSISVLRRLQQGGYSPLHYSKAFVLKELKGTIQVSIPTMTGNPFCPVNEETALQEPSSPHTLACTLVHSSWGLGYLALFASALVLAAWAVWQSWGRWLKQQDKEASETRQEFVRHSARLFLLCSAAMELFLFTIGNAPATWPGTLARYLIGLLIALPVVIWPLWYGITHVGPRSDKPLWLSLGGRQPQGFVATRWGTALRISALVKVRRVLCASILLFIGIMYLIGTSMTLAEIPAAQAKSQQQQALINHLLSIGATHIYTEYWTCDKLAFLSQEKIICGVLDNNLQPSHNNRVGRYYDIVSADPHSAYVFPVDYPSPALQQKVAQAGTNYRHFVFDGYNIYQPV